MDVTDIKDRHHLIFHDEEDNMDLQDGSPDGSTDISISEPDSEFERKVLEELSDTDTSNTRDGSFDIESDNNGMSHSTSWSSLSVVCPSSVSGRLTRVGNAPSSSNSNRVDAYVLYNNFSMKGSEEKFDKFELEHMLMMYCDKQMFVDPAQNEAYEPLRTSINPNPCVDSRPDLPLGPPTEDFGSTSRSFSEHFSEQCTVGALGPETSPVKFDVMDGTKHRVMYQRHFFDPSSGKNYMKRRAYLDGERNLSLRCKSV